MVHPSWLSPCECRVQPNLSKVYKSSQCNSYSVRRLQDYRQFYLYFKDIEIWHSRVPNLTWTHYRELLTVSDEIARQWYMLEAAKEMWSVRTLHRNISSQYYYRLLQSQTKDMIIDEMKRITAPMQGDKLEFI